MRSKKCCAGEGVLEPGELIALRHAMKNYLGRDSGLAAVIRAVVDGNLAPVGHTTTFVGSPDICSGPKICASTAPCRRPRHALKPSSTSGRPLPRWGIKSYVVRGLVQKGLLTVAAGYRHGLSKLIPERRTCTVSRRSTWRLRPSLFLSKDVAAQIHIPSCSS